MGNVRIRDLLMGVSWSRLQRQLLLAAIAGGVVLAFYLLTPGSGTLGRLSIATAYAGLFYLAVTLIIGPWNILRGASNPLSTYLRRDMGVIAGSLALAHTFIGLQVHLQGDFIQYFFYRTTEGVGRLRFDAFGMANQLGLVAALVFVILLGISNDASIRRLRPTTWKNLQKWNYVGAILVVLHGVLYQALEKRMFAFGGCLVVVAAITAIVQLLGFRRRRALGRRFAELEHR
jgi:methionine sulfoxide reductase heme-binding subunit